MWGSTPEIADGVQLLHHDVMRGPDVVLLHVAARALVEVEEAEACASVARRVGPHWWLYVPDASRTARSVVADASCVERAEHEGCVGRDESFVVVFRFRRNAGSGMLPRCTREPVEPRLAPHPLPLRPTLPFARPASLAIRGSSAALHARLAELEAEGYPCVTEMRTALLSADADADADAAVGSIEEARRCLDEAQRALLRPSGESAEREDEPAKEAGAGAGAGAEEEKEEKEKEQPEVPDFPLGWIDPPRSLDDAWLSYLVEHETPDAKVDPDFLVAEAERGAHGAGPESGAAKLMSGRIECRQVTNTFVHRAPHFDPEKQIEDLPARSWHRADSDPDSD